MTNSIPNAQQVLNNKLTPVLLFILCFANCNSMAKNYVLVKEFPPITITNATKQDILNAAIYLKRNGNTKDSGTLKPYVAAPDTDNKHEVVLTLRNVDTLYNTDTLLLIVANSSYYITDCSKDKVDPPGNPYLINYKINGKNFIERNGIIKIKKE